MKRLILTAALFAVSIIAFAQTKGANTIIVTMPDSGTVAWKRAAQVLTEKGFAIKSSDKDLLVISTDGKQVKRAGNVALSLSITGHKATLRGTQLVSGVKPTTIDYRGMKGSPALLGWEEMQAVATALGGSIAYDKR